MWNVPAWAELTLYVMIPLVMIALVAGVVWRIRKWFVGQPEAGAPSIRQQLWSALRPPRLAEVLATSLFQSRLARDRFAIVMHQAIFWGMVFLFIGTALATIDQDFTNLLLDWQLLSGNFYRLFEFTLDVFGVVLIAGVLMAAYRRVVQRPARLQPRRRGISLWDSFPLLTSLFLIAVTGFLVEGLRLAEGLKIEASVAAAPADWAARRTVLEQVGFGHRLHMGPERQEAEWSRVADGGAVFPAAMAAPVGYGLAQVLAPLSVESVRSLHQVLWWLHALLAFGLIVSIPFTKAFHLVASPANLLLHVPGPPGRLPVTSEAGVRTVRDFTWRQLLQVDACTWCGKCQEVCPGFNTGFPLSPRDLVQAIGSQLLRTRPRGNGETPSLHAALIPPAELWSCCACRACEDICPVHVEHPRLIIDLRRHLIDQGEVDEGVQDALMNFQRYGNSFGQSARKRPEWTKTLDFSLPDARKQAVEYLWFVGDYASYDQRAQAVTRSIARVLHQAGVDVGLLMDKEQNAGNDVRRLGEEGLFSLLREKNTQALAGVKFRKVLTTDPHTYNTLKNEYGASPAQSQTSPDASDKAAAEEAADTNVLEGKPVLHYTELLDELICQGTLTIPRSLQIKVTYHDPCYLGRFNGVYDAPRRILRALGAELVEMPRHRASSFCCGAGGGRLWMKDTPGIAERPAENRVREALALPGVQCLVVACPKDLVMFQDAIKTVGEEARLRVVDIGELVWEALAVPEAALT
jgi:Fe-S oxidoreductase/nitrate reductase gamma subunit